MRPNLFAEKHTEKLIFAAVCDWAGLVRGKAFPEADLDARLAKGMGYTHSNIMMSCFGPILTTPFGTSGDLVVRPDPAVRVEVDLGNGAAERFYLADLQNTNGTPWECCPRDFLRRAIAALARYGLTLTAAFEQEFVYTGIEARPGDSYALAAYRRQGSFGEALMAALRQAGLRPDSFMAEYGPCQFEVTVGPEFALRAADGAVIMREISRAVACSVGHRAIFAPMLEPSGTGNGTHIHMSLSDRSGPITYDPSAPYHVAERAAPFFAGILTHLPALTALTAPSVASYLRLTPNRWAPVHANFEMQDRGAAMRVAPIFATAYEAVERQFNIEYRVADATASPYLALGALIFAGVAGLDAGLALPAPGVQAQTLPRNLAEALDALAANSAAKSWFSETAMNAYLAFKRAEITYLDAKSPAEICALYADIY